jgi:LacI family transcriptional regulator
VATIQDVAVRAGVSTATVSRALNGKSTVNPALVHRVITAARELEYEPNGLARSLRRQETAVWALVITDIQNPFFTSVARGVEDGAQAAGYSVVLCNSDENPQKEQEYLKVSLQERVAGVILWPTSVHTDVSRLLEHDVAVVTIDRALRGRSVDAVLGGSRSGARRGTRHLVAQGYRRVACVTGPSGNPAADECLAGYEDAIRAHPGGDGDALVRRVPGQVKEGYAATIDLLAQPDPPDALFVANGPLAAGALEALAARRLRAGRDVGIVAFDDAPWTRLVDPPLTVVSQPAYDVGRTAARLLLSRLDYPSAAARTVTLGADLVVRGSSSR